MKKILSSSFLLLSTNLLSATELYKGCGVDEEQARLNLANNISVNVESTAFLEKENNTFFGLSNFSKTFTTQSKQTTNLSLKEITIQKENENTCATISKDKLLKLTQTLVTKVNGYTTHSLPKYEKEKVIKINSILQEIKNTIALVEVLNEDFSKNILKKLEKQQKKFTNLRTNYNTQFVKITIIGKYSNLLIDNKNVKQNNEVFLKSGNHKYAVTSDNHCKIEDKFTLNTNEDFEKVINMNDFNLPYMIISSNKKDATLTIDGKKHPLGVKYTSKTCDDTNIPYNIKYQAENENGTFTLSANETLEKDFTFYSQKELKNFSKLATNYEESSRLEIKYGYMNVNHKEEYKNYENLNTVQINYINTAKALRYGYGILYGESSNSSPIEGNKSTAYELYYNLGFELATLSDNTALHIGSVVIVPSITGQVGVGYHELYNEKTNTLVDKYDNTDDLSWKNNGIAKVNVGLDFVLSKKVALNIFTQKQYTMEKSLTFGGGLVLLF